jgi:hypothetical protein
LVVDRHGTMDLVSINFILPKGVLSDARGRSIADEVQSYIGQHGLGNGHVTHYHPKSWQNVEGGTEGGGPHGQ